MGNDAFYVGSGSSTSPTEHMTDLSAHDPINEVAVHSGFRPMRANYQSAHGSISEAPP